MAGVYLELFHGRKDPFVDLDDWGEKGPVVGPFRYLHTTYASDLKYELYLSCDDKRCEGCISVFEDMVYYDGMFYGDWSIFAEDVLDHVDLRKRLTHFDPVKAEIPASWAEARTKAAQAGESDAVV